MRWRTQDRSELATDCVSVEWVPPRRHKWGTMSFGLIVQYNRSVFSLFLSSDYLVVYLNSSFLVKKIRSYPEFNSVPICIKLSTSCGAIPCGLFPSWYNFEWILTSQHLVDLHVCRFCCRRAWVINDLRINKEESRCTPPPSRERNTQRGLYCNIAVFLIQSWVE